MAKILIVSSVFPPEPVVSAMLSKDIADILSKDSKVTVLCPKPSRPEGFKFDNFKAENFEVKRLDSLTCPSSNLTGRFRESYSFGLHCSKYLRKHAAEIDCIYINSWPLFSQHKIIKVANKFNIPTILHIQDIYPESLTGKLPFFLRKLVFSLLLPLDKSILNNANRIIGISPNMISLLSKSRRIPKDKFELVRNWQNDAGFLSYSPLQQNDQKEDFAFMYVGSLSQSAGVDSLIRSFDKAKMKGARLLIAGNGSDKQKCIDLVNDLGNHKIEFCDVFPQEVPRLQSQADVLLLPLKKGIANTATPSKFTAYLLSGKPVIATVEIESDVGNIISEAGCGFVVPPENIELLSQQMKTVFNMKRCELERMGENGRAYAIENLSRSSNLNKIREAILSLSLR